MKAIEQRLPKEIDKSFIVFREKGKFFPVPWHFHPGYELVQVTKSTGRRMVGDHIGNFDPHVWVNDPVYVQVEEYEAAYAIVVQFVNNFLGDHFLEIPEMHRPSVSATPCFCAFVSL